MKKGTNGQYITAEIIQEGFLIKNTDDVEEAWKALNYAGQVPPSEHHLYEVRSSGLHRKLPGQWSAFNLFEVKEGAPTRGAFPAVIFWRKPKFVGAE